MMKPEEHSFERLGHILEQQFMCPEQSLGCEGNLVNNNNNSNSSKKDEGVIKISRKCKLKISRDSHKISKRALTSCVQSKRPIIIYTYSPKVIHTQPSNFMWLVQSLTGSSETRSRCLKCRSGELTADVAATSYSSLTTLTTTTTTMDTQNSKPLGSSPGMNNHARASSPHGSRGEADFHQQQLSPHPPHRSRETSPAPCKNCHLGKEPARIIDCGTSPSLPNSTNYSHTIEQLSSSYRITQNVSPRGPFSATEFEDAAPFSTTITTTAPAPAFEKWSPDQNYQLRSSSGLPQGPFPNYISNLNHAAHHLSNNHGLPFSYTVNATPWTVDSLLQSPYGNMMLS